MNGNRPVLTLECAVFRWNGPGSDDAGSQADGIFGLWQSIPTCRRSLHRVRQAYGTSAGCDNDNILFHGYVSSPTLTSS